MPPESARGSGLVSDSMVVRASPGPPKGFWAQPWPGWSQLQALCCPLVLGQPPATVGLSFSVPVKVCGGEVVLTLVFRANPHSCGLSRNQGGQ